jgi:hypothetical protein
MLADAEGRLRWATAAGERARIAEDTQEALGQGPCQVAFARATPAMERDGVDGPAAFERLRTSARSSRRTVAEIARDLLASVARRNGRRPAS